MKHTLLIITAFLAISITYAADKAPADGRYLLICDDGNLHAQACTLSRKDDVVYLSIDQAEFFPKTGPLKLFPLSDTNSGYRAVITPAVTSKSGDQDIDTCVITLKPMKSGFYGEFSATRSSVDSSFKGKLLLYPIQR